MNAIRPELIAAKIETGWLDSASARNTPYTPAQINELLWWLQSRSTGKGGLKTLVADILASHPLEFGNEAMVKLGAPKSGKYTLEECLVIWQEQDATPGSPRSCVLPNRDEHGQPIGEPPEEKFIRHIRQYGWSCTRLAEFQWLFLDGNITAEKVMQNDGYNREMILAACEHFNWDRLTERCREQAVNHLPGYLQALCEDERMALDEKSYCPGLVRLLFDYMGRCAFESEKSIAQTAVTRRVFRELEFALSAKVPVPIIGESRIGKTSPAAAWCAMRPGRARLVTVPPSSRMREFIEAHADAFGIEHSLSTPTSAMVAKVKYVHLHSGMMLLYDEAAHLIPTSYSKSTPPARIDFVRSQVIDRNLPCAFFATPQSYKQTLDQYSQVTARKMTEWLGRLAPAVILPPDLDSADMMQVARIHFPELPEPYLKLIIARAMQSEGYLKNMEFAAKRALFNAQQAGRVQPDLADVKLAIEEMMPQAPAAAPARRPIRTAAASPPPPTRAVNAEPAPDPGSPVPRFEVDRPDEAVTAP